jgi:hypothetical protein
MKYFMLFILASYMFFGKHINLANASTIVHVKVDSAKEQLLLDIFKMAVSKSAPGSVFSPTESLMTATRAVEELKTGGINVFWAGVTPKLEETFRPIYIPVLKGLLGHRIFIIKKGKQSLFDNINNLSDLKALKAGQGKTWGDTKVLKAADIPTATTLKYNNLFRMLEGDRFDYFPRAVHEPWSEVVSRPELNLTVEKRILLIYPFAMYFFVEKDNKRLHDIINEGLELAIKDGSFDRLFFSNQLIKDAMQNSNLKERVVIRIPNSDMSPKTPFDRKDFWLDINKL